MHGGEARVDALLPLEGGELLGDVLGRLGVALEPGEALVGDEGAAEVAGEQHAVGQVVEGEAFDVGALAPDRDAGGGAREDLVVLEGLAGVTPDGVAGALFAAHAGLFLAAALAGAELEAPGTGGGLPGALEGLVGRFEEAFGVEVLVDAVEVGDLEALQAGDAQVVVEVGELDGACDGVGLDAL